MQTYEYQYFLKTITYNPISSKILFVHTSYQCHFAFGDSAQLIQLNDSTISLLLSSGYPNLATYNSRSSGPSACMRLSIDVRWTRSYK